MQTPESIDQSIDERTEHCTDERTDERNEQRTEQRNEQRIDDLEIKASFSDELLEQLNAIVARQQMEIAALIREVQHLREQIPPRQNLSTNLLQELPPHY